METYLQTLGWWNFMGSLMMLGFLYEPFGQKVLNEWTRIFSTPFVLDYWGKLWLFWAVGLNIFFGLVNIQAAGWGHEGMMRFLVISDLCSYSVFVALTAWGVKSGHCGPGIYSVFLIFSGWLGWGLWVLLH